MDIIDLATGGLIETVFYDSQNIDPNNTYYDISSDGKVFASIGIENDQPVTRLIDADTKEVLQTMDGTFTFMPSLDGTFSWKERRPKSDTQFRGTCKIGLDNTHVYEHYKEIISNEDRISVIYTYDSLYQSLELWDVNTCNLIKQIFSCKTLDSVANSALMEVCSRI